MKKSLFVLLAASALLYAGCGISVENAVICAQLDPLEKVFTEESYFVDNPDTAAVAKGETATFQFVVRCAYRIQDLKVEAGNLVNGNRQIPFAIKAFVGYIRAGKHEGDRKSTDINPGGRSKDAIITPSDYYPDCLQEVETIHVQPMQNQPVWVTYAIPRDAAAGDYDATLVFTGKIGGKPFKITKKVTAKVYPVVLPEQTLWVTQWYSTGFDKMNGGEPVQAYSDRYWELHTILANKMRDYGSNAYIVGRPGIQVDGTKYTFDFTRFDETVEFLIREGGLKRIAGSHFAGRPRGDDGWYEDFEVYVPKIGTRPWNHESVQNFLSQYFTAIYKHLEEKGWTSMYMQHVADEPLDENAESYIHIADYVKKYMPGVPVIDAIMSHKLANTVGVWVPLLNTYHKDYAFYKERQAAGDEVWFYSCVASQDNYANRYLEQPLSHTRYVHWINYRYGATGYLHWAFNQWGYYDKLKDASAFGETWPGGESFISYPAYEKVYSSIRLEAMRDGLNDYELLKLLEKKSPDKANELASRIIRDFDNYNNNVRAFRLTRQELLKALSD